MEKIEKIIISILVLFIVGFVMSGTLLIVQNVDKYSETNCTYVFVAYLPESPDTFSALLNVTAGSVTQLLGYGNGFRLGDSVKVDACYLSQCEGINCPLISFTNYDNLILLGAFLIFGAIFFTIMLVVRLCVLQSLKDEIGQSTFNYSDDPPPYDGT